MDLVVLQNKQNGEVENSYDTWKDFWDHTVRRNWIPECESSGYAYYGYSLFIDGAFAFAIDKQGNLIFNESDVPIYKRGGSF